MRYVEREEFESGDKVRLIDDSWYIKHGFEIRKTDIMTVKYQDDDEVITDKGIFEFYELELIEE